MKLDTNGSLPDVLSAVIRERLVDYVAMDIKAPFRKYEAAAGGRSTPMQSGKVSA